MLQYFLVSGGVLAAAMIVVVIFQSGSFIEIVLNNIGFKPSRLLIVTVISAVGVAWISMSLLLLSLQELKIEYDEFVDAEADKGRPTATPPPATTPSPRQHLIAYYEARGYHKIGTINDQGSFHKGVIADLFAQEPDLNTKSVWNRKAVLIYEDSTYSSFQVAVLYSDESWQKSDTEHVQQKRLGRPVHIKNAINRPFLKTMLESSDYALCLGLASSDQIDPPQKNETLADDRAYHCGSAIIGRGFQSAARVRAFGMGYALTKTTDKEILARQRSVIVVGVDTSSAPAVNDVIQAIAMLVTLTGVDLKQYSGWQSGWNQFFRISPDKFDGTASIVENEDDDPDLLKLVPLPSVNEQ